MLEFPGKCEKITRYWYIKKRDFSDENIGKFLYYISQLPWPDFYAESDVNKSFSIFHEELTLYYELCFPLL